MSFWNTKATLTETEQRLLDGISTLFTPRQSEPQAAKVEQTIVEVTVEPPSLKQMVGELSGLLKEHEKLALKNLKTIQEMEKSKGQVLASTKDFQQTCLVILNKQSMLTNVVNEI